MAYIAEGNDKNGNPSLGYLVLLREGARKHGLPEHWSTHLYSVQRAE